MDEKTKKSINPLIFAAILLLIGGILTFVLFKNNSENKNINTKQSNQTAIVNPSQASKENENTKANSEVREIEVEGGSFYFKPNEIKVKRGEKVKIVFKSVSMMHDFVVEELNIRVPITKSGNTSTIEFVAEKIGEFEYYCSVGSHREMGQVGKLIVE